ncbi:DUF1640 domain-containing protein [Bathymodiolus platifrons methanotrophic gill symbiont]|uniref:DUF1640 domain-containing protein n=1 Tax=Bathymodiolus platifrons methanotrophic gill symbiont TaxID=113268 RepID=UPI000B4188C9|nr:DUF1640 domain-containing protein [Bathymodiolus platifrons methanotrophic gill symbiont]MCK5870751.1 DUF1640 domain-containing protein [Methyloprofundus sp.]
MTTLVFDTYDFVRRLQDAGFSETQAEILTQLQQESVDATLEQFHNVFCCKLHYYLKRVPDYDY